MDSMHDLDSGLPRSDSDGRVQADHDLRAHLQVHRRGGDSGVLPDDGSPLVSDDGVDTMVSGECSIGVDWPTHKALNELKKRGLKPVGPAKRRAENFNDVVKRLIHLERVMNGFWVAHNKRPAEWHTPENITKEYDNLVSEMQKFSAMRGWEVRLER